MTAVRETGIVQSKGYESPPGPNNEVEGTKHGSGDGKGAHDAQPANDVDVEDLNDLHSAPAHHEGAAQRALNQERSPGATEQGHAQPHDSGPLNGTEDLQHGNGDIEMNSAYTSLRPDRSLVDEGPGASIPISIPNEGAPSPGGQIAADEEDEESTNSKYGWRLLQLAILVGVVCALIFGGQAVGEAVEELRSSLQKIPIWAFTLGLIIVNFLRLCIPPAYFLFPVGTVSAMYYGDAMGAMKGALVLKLCELVNALAFLVIRRFYAAPIQDLFENGETRFSRAIPSSIRQGLQHFDNNWRSWIIDKPWYQELAVMTALQISFYMDDLITILWLASRSQVTWQLYCLGLLLFLCADYPRKVLQVDTFIAASDALSSGGNFLLEFFKAFTRIPTWQVICVVLFSVSATVFVHGNHLYVVVNLFRTCCGGEEAAKHEFDKVEEGSRDRRGEESDQNPENREGEAGQRTMNTAVQTPS